jgi:uncharacterized integral membrane protein (TIGR00698 family)
LFLILAIATLHPLVPSAIALISGILFALVLGNPYLKEQRLWTPRFLQVSVMGLGATMNLTAIVSVGVQGFGYTLVGILITMMLGQFLGRLLKIPRDTMLLISSGTAICGGSAIAAVASVINPKPAEMSVSLLVVFLLNAVALVAFPPIGHEFHLSQQQFGLWSALAIHDMSSVAGAALHYGPRALAIGTIVKMARALWIIPLALGLRLFFTRSEGGVGGKIKKPWFILGFIALAAIVTWVPELQSAGEMISIMAKRMLVLTLFLIGTSLTKEALANIGFKSFLFGFALWLMVGAGTFLLIRSGWIALNI